MPALTFSSDDAVLRIVPDSAGVTLTRSSTDGAEQSIGVGGDGGKWLAAICDGSLTLCAVADYKTAVGAIAIKRVEAVLEPKTEPVVEPVEETTSK